MSIQYQKLLEKARMGTWELPNRIVMAPMGSLNATNEGFVTDNTLAFYKDMAKGGNGLIIVECTYMDEELSKGEDNCMGLTCNAQITGMARLASIIHDEGAKAVLQLCHIGHQLALAPFKDSLGPSEMTEMMGGVIPFPIRGMTKTEIKRCIDNFAMSAWRAKMAGFDGVEIHGAIGHLINMFCTPYYNRRTDEYGGTPENRIRFMKEIIEAVHDKCGKNYPVIGRICGCDYDPDGISMEEGCIHAQILEKTGIVALHVVAGSNRNVRTINCQYDKRGDFLYAAENLKKAGIRTPIIIDGGLTTPDLAEKVLLDGTADFIGIGRPMLADPDWVLKLRENRPEDIRPCIRCCMGCVGTMEEFDAARGLRCSVNPTCNMTAYRQLRPLNKKKKVCIIGGGPGGMEAALTASKRGHEVTLYEKKALGGMLIHAAFDQELKGDLVRLIGYYKIQLEKSPIQIIYEEADAEKIRKGNYDVIIDATGSVSANIKPEKAGNVRLHPILSVNSEMEKSLGERVLVVGGCFPNVEIAYSLAKKGHKVILTTRRKSPAEIGTDNSSPQYQRLAILSAMSGVKNRCGLNFKKISEDGAIFETVDQKEKVLIACDDVIVCRGFHGSKILYQQIADAAPEIYRIGDALMSTRCKEHSTVGKAIEDGWAVGNRI